GCHRHLDDVTQEPFGRTRSLKLLRGERECLQGRAGGLHEDDTSVPGQLKEASWLHVQLGAQVAAQTQRPFLTLSRYTWGVRALVVAGCARDATGTRGRRPNNSPTVKKRS